MMNKYKGKTVLVTGASRGIGKAIAKKFAEQGAYVLGTATTKASADNISNEYGEKGKGLVLNLGNKESIENFATVLEKLTQPQILINNAGITRDNLLMRMKDEEWNTVIETNLTGIYKITKLCLRAMMKARYGRIINITSVVGLSGNAGQTNYSAAKAGVIGFTRSLAREVGSRGITVNAVAPGFIETDMTDNLGKEMKENLLKQIVLARFGSPEEVASVVHFLVSDESNYITGQTINVNGGMYMG